MPHFERLEQLAAHLESGHLGHEEFDFSVYNNSNGPCCGFNGCAIGECPTLWPNDWYFNEIGIPYLKNFDGAMESGCEWFGINEKEFKSLFVPFSRRVAWNVAPLVNSSTKEQVAEGIRHFVQYMKAREGVEEDDNQH